MTEPARDVGSPVTGRSVQRRESPECIALMEGFIQESPALWNEEIDE